MSLGSNQQNEAKMAVHSEIVVSAELQTYLPHCYQPGILEDDILGLAAKLSTCAAMAIDLDSRHNLKKKFI